MSFKSKTLMCSTRVVTAYLMRVINRKFGAKALIRSSNLSDLECIFRKELLTKIIHEANFHNIKVGGRNE